jgi:hypothetical protein
VVIVNARPSYDGEPCSKCSLDPAPGDAWYGMVASELGWCGCGPQEHLDRLMYAYLDQDGPVLRAEGDAGMLLAFIADDLGWTEHGGNIGGSWLTNAGAQARANLGAVVATYDDEEPEPPPVPKTPFATDLDAMMRRALAERIDREMFGGLGLRYEAPLIIIDDPFPSRPPSPEAMERWRRWMLSVGLARPS